VLRRRFQEITAKTNVQDGLILEQAEQLTALEEVLARERKIRGLRKVYHLMGREGEGRRRRKLPRGGNRNRQGGGGEEGGEGEEGEEEEEDEKEAMREEIDRLEGMVRDLTAYNEATEGQLRGVHHLLLTYVLRHPQPRHVRGEGGGGGGTLSTRWFGLASRNEVREALREEGHGLLRKDTLNEACRVVEMALEDERIDPLERDPDTGEVVAVNRKLRRLQEIGLEYGKGVVELIVAKKREMARFGRGGGGGGKVPGMVLWEEGRGEVDIVEGVARLLGLRAEDAYARGGGGRWGGKRPRGTGREAWGEAREGRGEGGDEAGGEGAEEGDSIAGGRGQEKGGRRPRGLPHPAGSGRPWSLSPWSSLPPSAPPSFPPSHPSVSRHRRAMSSLPPSPPLPLPLLLLPVAVHDAFGAWLAEHTTLRAPLIAQAGGQIDQFLARVAAAAAGGRDVHAEETDLPFPQVGRRVLGPGISSRAGVRTLASAEIPRLSCPPPPPSLCPVLSPSSFSPPLPSP
jgi:hypothetical protein